MRGELQDVQAQQAAVQLSGGRWVPVLCTAQGCLGLASKGRELQDVDQTEAAGSGMATLWTPSACFVPAGCAGLAGCACCPAASVGGAAASRHSPSIPPQSPILSVHILCNALNVQGALGSTYSNS